MRYKRCYIHGNVNILCGHTGVVIREFQGQSIYLRKGWNTTEPLKDELDPSQGKVALPQAEKVGFASKGLCLLPQLHLNRRVSHGSAS